MTDATPTRLPVPKRKRRKREPLWNDEIEWLLRAGARALGERGTLASVVATLQLGGATGGVPNTDPYTDDQLRDVRRSRRLFQRWHRLSQDAQAVLLAHYHHRPPQQQELCNRRRTSRAGWPQGAERIGDCAALALWLARADGKIDRLCTQCRKPSGGPLVTLYRERAEAGIRAAHAEWSRLAVEEARAWAA